MTLSDENFISITDQTTGEVTYCLKFEFGNRTINVKPNQKINLNYIHGGFINDFTREGNDLVIGGHYSYAHIQRLGIGFGKEVWDVTQNEDSTYSVSIREYRWGGGSVGYLETDVVRDVVMTEQEMADFQSEHNVTVQTGTNTLYITWPVVPPFPKHYHMNDGADYDPPNGIIRLKNYFLYGKDTVYIGDKLLSDILVENNFSGVIDNSDSIRRLNITDTFLDENIYGGVKSDKIRSLAGNDTIDGGKGNDIITLGSGNKTIIINQESGADTIYNFYKADSVEISQDSDNVYYTKSGNNLVINRGYGDAAGQTVIKDYFKTWSNENNIIITNGDDILASDLTQELSNGDKHITLKTNSLKVVGTALSDEAYSSGRNETFVLGTGNDIIRFCSDSGISVHPYEFGNDVVKLTKGSHITLDMENIGDRYSYERSGNDAIIKVTNRIQLDGRDNGMEEWYVKRSGADYKITKTEYCFTGSGYEPNGVETEVTMTKDEFKTFQKENGVSLKFGKNTLYTSWAVVPDPVIHYSMTDGANYGWTLGTVTIKDFFKYDEDSVYVGENSLQEIFMSEYYLMDKSVSNKKQTMTDSFMNEIIKGGKKADKIISNYGDDIITGGKGNDTIMLGSGEKTVHIGQCDGRDTLIISEENTSANIVFDMDVDKISFTQSGNNLVINREYGIKTEHTVIKDYYKNNIENDIKISVGNSVWFDGLGSDVANFTAGLMCQYPPMDVVEPVQHMDIPLVLLPNV
ncbi:MAG: hypothetical protein K6E29_01290 [Cyanobacteria bacterium RUI128]|nr:hypothetical protein [Cyanobacteria bacterium RUI128]